MVLKSIIAFLFSVSIASAAIYDCGSGATAIVTHPSTITDKLTINGVQNRVSNDQNLVFDCYSLLDVTCSDGVDNRVTIIPKSLNATGIIDFSMLISFLIGALVAIAFVIAVDTAFNRGSV